MTVTVTQVVGMVGMEMVLVVEIVMEDGDLQLQMQ